MTPPKDLVVGLIGFGNVGRGVFEILGKNAAEIHRRTGRKILVKTVVVRSPERYHGYPFGNAALSQDPNAILNDPEIDVVVEAIGGDTGALDFARRALTGKKHVVTANKMLVSKHKTELFRLAHENRVELNFEASVGGGIPIIHAFHGGYAANQIQCVYGILNGTTNYILTKIQDDQKEFLSALKEAQKLGFAEADPTMDVSGYDAACKLIILAAVAFKVDLRLEDVFYEGIEKVSLKDMRYANEMGYTVKLIASGRYLEPDVLSFKVHPTFVPQHHPLASVRNEFNAIFTIGNAMGESMMSGRGAGSFPTGSAIVSDLMEIAENWQQGSLRNSRSLTLADFRPLNLRPIDQTSSKFYIRMRLADTFGVLEKVTHAFVENQVNISKLLQKESVNSDAEIVVVTHKVGEQNMSRVIKQLKRIPDVKKVSSVIRVDLDDFYPQGAFSA